MNSYIDSQGRVICTTLSSPTIAKSCCQICAATMLRVGLWLCDYPVIEDHGLTKKIHKTCDVVLCNAHAYKIAEQVNMKDEAGAFVDDVHICPAHYEEWQRLGKPKFWLDQ